MLLILKKFLSLSPVEVFSFVVVFKADMLGIVSG